MSGLLYTQSVCGASVGLRGNEGETRDGGVNGARVPKAQWDEGAVRVRGGVVYMETPRTLIMRCQFLLNPSFLSLKREEDFVSAFGLRF